MVLGSEHIDQNYEQTVVLFSDGAFSKQQSVVPHAASVTILYPNIVTWGIP
jgi:hypothetical protein